MRIRLSILLYLVLLCSIITEGLVIDPATRMRISRNLKPQSRAEQTDSITTPPYQPLILQISDDSVVTQLLDLDVIIYNRRSDLLLTSVPVDNLDAVLVLDGILNAAASGDMSSVLNIARPFGKVSSVQSMTLPYTGKGVVVGFSDIGFDPHHIAFKNRIVQLHNYNSEYGIIQDAVSPEEIAAWTTDDPYNYHATHVGNILGGNYQGNQYYGVATGAEMIGTTSRLHDVGILAGVEDIIAYAKSKGKPAVVNLSLSNYLGAHDGSSLMCQYLSRCAEDAIICISAGNTGHINGFATQDLSITDAQVLVNTLRNAGGYKVEGYTDIWSDSDLPFEFSISIYDGDNKQEVYTSDWVTGDSIIIISDRNDEAWAKYMTGTVYAGGGISPLNGRYNVIVSYSTEAPEKSNRGEWNRYSTCINMRQLKEIQRPVRVNIFADAIYSCLGKVSTNPTRVNANGSINDMCTAPGVIGVGMATSRNTAPCLNGEELKWDLVVDQITPYSSYSDTYGIEPLPHIAGPGSYLVSAMSNYYLQEYPDTEVSALSQVDGNDYYWFASGGTSMSSPYVAGVYALWLEADPTLTPAELIEISQLTAQRDFADIDNPRWGAGCIDAYAGLQEVIKRASIQDITLPTVVKVDSDRRLILNGIDTKKVRLYSVDGRQIEIDAQLHPGVYVLTSAEQTPIKILIE